MGRKKKIAPTLQEFVAGHLYQPGAGADAVRRELRALLAVARAANNHWCDFCDGYHSDVSVDVPAWKAAGGRVCPEAHALARLERAGEEER